MPQLSGRGMAVFLIAKYEAKRVDEGTMRELLAFLRAVSDEDLDECADRLEEWRRGEDGPDD